MAEFKLNRIRFRWRNTWAATTAYIRDDVIRYGGKTFVCIVGHTASSNFYTDSINWSQMTDGNLWRSSWATAQLYNVNDLVTYGGNIYICNTSHTSSSAFASDFDKWTTYVLSAKWRDDWTASTLYAAGDLVQYNGIVYSCTAEHISSTESNGIEIYDGLVIHNTVVNSSLIGGDIDYVTFTVGNDDITELYLTKYVGVDEIAFFAIQQGSSWTAGVDVNQMVAYSHFGPGAPDYQVGDNILSEQNAVLTANTTYTMWIQQTGSNITEYLFSTDPTHFGIADPLPSDYSNNPASPTTVVFKNSKWEVYYENIAYRSEFIPGSRYVVNDLVKYGGTIWRCIESHTSGDDSTINFVPEYWTLEFPGQQFRGAWDSNIVYAIGDTVVYGGYTYIAQKANEDQLPVELTGDWILVSKNYNLRGDWSHLVDYRTGDVVRHGGGLYVADADAPGQPADTVVYTVTIGAPVSGETGDKYYLNDEYKPAIVLEIGNTYIFDQSDRTNVFYPNANGSTENTHPLSFSSNSADGLLSGGTAYFKSVVYKLNNVEVTSEEYADGFANAIIRTVEITPTINTPSILYYWSTNSVGMGNIISVDPISAGIDPAVNFNWKKLTLGEQWLGGWRNSQTYAIGDVVSYRNKNYTCIVSHLADEDENYPDNGNGYNYWQGSLEGDLQNALSNRGDLLGFGLLDDTSSLGPKPISIGQPNQLLTVTSSREQNYKYFNESQNFRYVAPNGVDSEDRGTRPDIPWKTIRYATEQSAKLVGFTTIKIQTGHYYEIIPIIVPAKCVLLGDELRAVTVEAAPPVEELSQDSTYTQLVLSRLKDIIPDVIANNTISKISGNTETQITYLQDGAVAAGNDIQNLIDDIIEYIEFYVNSGPSDPAMTGSNTPTSNDGYYKAAAILQANKEFLAAEAVAFMTVNFPVYAFNSETCKRDVRAYVDAWSYDIIYTGNYKSLLAARYYRNAVLGCAGEDMFYVRDASGIRNMTTTGLVGSLNPANVFNLYQVPTGGAYVSLDPGWGPDDTSTWIVTRSPYIQNVTTFGTGCVGQKVDGALHNGGNKSVVSNDFTQVLSDGIGAWILNKGRVEMVSVFTYYCHVGYLAEDGGTIRGTNGNCSYGRFGALAQGIDPDEIPQTGTVDARNNDASVSSVLAGEFANEILLLEFANAGQEYTSVTYTVVGSGTGADLVEDDFRDGAVFESRITTAGDSSGFGGGGFLVVGNNAQTGDDTTITLAANDGNTIFEYLGMRIIIVSGPGTGQYGYISGYNNISKVVSVAKESDGSAGWDHVISGTPIESVLTTQTTYRIEPRPVFSAPAESISSGTMPSANWNSIAFGNTYETYTNLVGTIGTGGVVGDDGLVPLAARFNVVKDGRDYTVTMTNPGAGYAIDDEVLILGTSLGGLAPDNNITIKVLSTTDDSTNSIVSFSYDGKGSSGRYVAVTSDSATLAYSSNGNIWNSVSLGNNGNWIVGAGGTEFVAIRSSSTGAASSINGTSWTARTLPAASAWTSVAYGDGTWVAVASDTNSGAYSTDGGASWTTMTLPTVGDSTLSQWQSVTYGKRLFVAVSSSNQATAYSSDGITWTGGTLPGGIVDWNSVAYGNNRFVAIASTGNEAAISFDGITWIESSMPSEDGSTQMNWKDIKYGQGLFFAVCDTGGANIGEDPTTGPTTFAATSEDGVTWETKTLLSSESWTSVAFGNPLNVGTWIAVASGPTTNNAKVITGIRAKGRVTVSSGRIGVVKLWEVGSGYTSEPTLTVIDPNNTSELFVENRIGNGVLSQPSFVNRGSAYRTSSTRVTITGNGFADIVPVGKFITLEGLDFYPKLGAQITFDGYEQIYTVVNLVTNGGVPGNYSATFQVSPPVDIQDNYYHGLVATVRERYSQCRLTGHDFLDIGTGNFIETNYPNVDTLNKAPENEVIEGSGGRVFYTSTDQDGNFRTGELFQVEQATGIVTISADFFDLGGLTELALGGVRLGGSGTVIREFSTDATFTENSNNVVPTQRAIRAYLANRLSQGGSELTTGSFVAGQISVGPAAISTTTGTAIEIPVLVDFSGDAAISGLIMAQTMFYNATNQRKF